MKFYQKKAINIGVTRQVEKKRETRNAIVWDVFPDQRKARVKIQGSNEYITCHYPTNWKDTPSWLRQGQSVKIRHSGGVRGKLELDGYSLLLPTPQAGQPQAPDIAIPVDTIILGLQLFTIPSGGEMKVAVSAGKTRFDGIESGTIYIKMSATSEMEMGYNLVMGETAEVVAISAAPGAGLARYDLIVVGSDLVFDKVEGSAAAVPIMPDTPADHLLCGFLLIPHGTTEILQSNINNLYTTRRITSLTVTSSDEELTWSELSCTITVIAKDQYGNEITQSGGWYFTLTIANGNGTVDNQEGDSSTSSVGKFTLHSSTYAEFTYTRDKLATDQSPALVATVNGYSATGNIVIILLDASGDPM